MLDCFASSAIHVGRRGEAVREKLFPSLTPSPIFCLMTPLLIELRTIPNSSVLSKSRIMTAGHTKLLLA